MGGNSVSRKPRPKETKIQTLKSGEQCALKIDEQCAMFCSSDDFDAQQHMEESAAKLCKIQPHHWVLVVGFGKGHGLTKALERIQGGSGKVCGTETSSLLVARARGLYEFELCELKLEINHCPPHNIPYMRNSFERVFMVNGFPDWDDIDSCLQELYRMMRPGCAMVTCYSNLMSTRPSKHAASSKKHSLDTFVEALKENAFVRIKVEEHRHADTGFKYHAIYAFTRRRK